MITIAVLLIAVKHNPKEDVGICGQPNVKAMRQESFELLKKAMTEWPKYSGDRMYPVPAPRYPHAASKAFLECANMWDKNAEYGALRWELLDWLIAHPALNKVGKTP